MPAPGKKAPAFTLPNQDGKKVKLGDFQGRKLLVFAYPKAATGGCTSQARGFRDHLAAIEEVGGAVLGISPDPVDKLKRWHDKEAFGYDLLSDPDHEVLEKWGAWGEKKLYGKTYEGVIRSHWVIGPDGRVLDEKIKISPAKSVEQGVDAMLGD